MPRFPVLEIPFSVPNTLFDRLLFARVDGTAEELRQGAGKRSRWMFSRHGPPVQERFCVFSESTGRFGAVFDVIIPNTDKMEATVHVDRGSDNS